MEHDGKDFAAALNSTHADGVAKAETVVRIHSTAHDHTTGANNGTAGSTSGSSPGSSSSSGSSEGELDNAIDRIIDSHDNGECGVMVCVL